MESATARNSEHRAAFTLIELLVVISIIALLSSMVLASLNAARGKAWIGAARQFASQAERIVGEQAVGIWDFDECTGNIANDRSGFGNHGTITGSSEADWSADTPSNSGCTLWFNGIHSTDATKVVSPLVYRHQPSFTLAIWIKPETTNNFQVVIGSAIGNSVNAGLRIDGSQVLFYDNTSGGAIITSPPVLKLNRWHHIAVTYNNGNSALYINGSSGGTGISTLSGSSGSVVIGSPSSNSYAAYTRAFQGYIDEARVFNESLTASEIGKLYAESAPKYRFADAE